MFHRLKNWRELRKQRLAAKTIVNQSDPAAREAADDMRNPIPTVQQQRSFGG